MAETKPKLIYFSDPMCSWCYGFSPEISEALERLGETVDFQLVMGGLRPYNTETMEGLGDFLKEHWDHVHERSGQPFCYDILEDTNFVYDTEPPSRAVVVMKKLKPKAIFEFFQKIQEAFYKENKNTNLTETYLDLAAEFDVDKKVFQKEFESEEMKKAVRSEFTFTAKVGVRGFPTVVLLDGKHLHLLSNGYTTSDILVEKCNRILSEKD